MQGLGNQGGIAMGARNTGSIRGNGYVHYTDCDDGLDLNTYVKTDIVHIKYV